MATKVAAAGGGNWNTGATWVGGVKPTAADDVQIDATSGNVTLDAAGVCRSLDFNGYTGTFTWGAFTITIGDGTSGLGNRALRIVAGMTLTLSNAVTSAVSFVGSSGTVQTIDTGGKTLGSVTVNHASGKWQQVSALTSTGNFTHTASSTATGWDTNGNQMTLSGAGRTHAFGTKTYTDLVNLTGSGTTTITGEATFNGGLNHTGTAVKTDALSLANNITVASGTTNTLAGNSTTNRLLVRSSVTGTQRTITNTGATMTWSNVDFRDIALSTPYDASAITGKSGDCGGNSNITFTPATTQTATGTTSFTWSTHGWTTRVPLPQDDVVINNAFGAGRTVTADMPRLGKSIDFTGCTGSPSISGFANPAEFYGSLTLISGMSWSCGGLRFCGRGSYTLTSAGKTISTLGMTLEAPGGTLSLQDALTIGGAYSLTVTCGTLTTNDFSILSGSFIGGATAATIINLGASTWTFNGTGTFWTMTAGNTTINAGTSTLKPTDTSATSKTFAGSGKTYNIFSWTTGGTGAITISGSNSFSQWTHTGGTTKTITVTAGTTQTFTAGSPALNAAIQGGAAGNLITIQSSSASIYTIASSTRIYTDYISLSKSTASGGTPFYAGANSTDGGGNTLWTFTDAPATLVGRKRGIERAMCRAMAFN